MRTLGTLLITSCLAGLPMVAGAQSQDDLIRRCDEQERQIRRLELENSRLRELLADQREDALDRRAAEAASEAAKQAPTPEVPQPATTREEQPAQASTHKVRSGETLSEIARQHGTTTGTLVKLNGLKDASMLRVGQTLKLPGGTAEAPRAASGTHTVQSGDTYFRIARKHGISVSALTAANPGVNPNALRIGQKLNLAAAEAPAAPAAAEKTSEPEARPTAKAADKPAAATEKAAAGTVTNQPVVRSIRLTERITFGDFAAKHGTSTAKLNALNGLNLEPKQVLAEGSELYVSAQPMD